MPDSSHHGAKGKGKSGTIRIATSDRDRATDAGMPRRTKPTPYNADRVRAGIRAALEFRGETSPNDVCKRAEIAEKTLDNLFKGRSQTIQLDSLVCIATELRLTVSQLIGETPLEAPAAPGAGAAQAKDRLIAAQNELIAALREELAEHERSSG